MTKPCPKDGVHLSNQLKSAANILTWNLDEQIQLCERRRRELQDPSRRFTFTRMPEQLEALGVYSLKLLCKLLKIRFPATVYEVDTEPVRCV